MKNETLRICAFIARHMAWLVVAASMAGFLWPETCGRVRTAWISPMLGCVMFGMGLTLDPSDFLRVLARPRDVAAGFCCQFTIMPLLGWALARAFGLPQDLAVGVILVGCCPGGTASNVITYLARGDLPLSVAMTAASTLVAPVAVPLLVKLLAGAYVPVDFWGMFLSVAEVVLLPIALGLLCRRFLPRATARATPFLPAFSSLAVALIVMAVVTASADKLRTCGPLVFAVVVLHNGFGYALGFIAAKLLRLNPAKTVAVSVEVGMQNSGLACSLAKTHFDSLALATVPGAVFSVWHNISGALLARLYSAR